MTLAAVTTNLVHIPLDEEEEMEDEVLQPEEQHREGAEEPEVDQGIVTGIKTTILFMTMAVKMVALDPRSNLLNRNKVSSVQVSKHCKFE